MRKNVSEKIASPTPSIMMKWVDEALRALEAHPNLVKRAFEATGISLDPSVVNSEHLKEAMRLCGESLKSQFVLEFAFDLYRTLQNVYRKIW